MQTWNNKFNEEKIFTAVYKLSSESFKFDTYRKTFKKLMDYFDPHDDKFLLTESIYRDLYNMREQHAMKVDCNPAAIVKDVDLLATARLIVDKYRLELDEPRLRSMLPAPMYIQQIKKTMHFFEKSKPHLK